MNDSLHSAVTGILTVLSAVGWFVGLRPNDGDKDTADCHEFILESLSNADAMRTIEAVTDHNVREQLTVAQAIELSNEAELRRFERRN